MTRAFEGIAQIANVAFFVGLGVLSCFPNMLTGILFLLITVLSVACSEFAWRLRGGLATVIRNENTRDVDTIGSKPHDSGKVGPPAVPSSA